MSVVITNQPYSEEPLRLLTWDEVSFNEGFNTNNPPVYVKKITITIEAGNYALMTVEKYNTNNDGVVSMASGQYSTRTEEYAVGDFSADIKVRGNLSGYMSVSPNVIPPSKEANLKKVE